MDLYNTPYRFSFLALRFLQYRTTKIEKQPLEFGAESYCDYRAFLPNIFIAGMVTISTHALSKESAE